MDRPGLSEVALGVMMLLILVRRPAGLTGGKEFAWPNGGRRTSQSSSVQTATAGSSAPALR